MNSSDDELNEYFNNAMNMAIHQHNVEPSLMDSDDESVSSFTMDDMLSLDQAEHNEWINDQEGGALHGPLPPLYNFDISPLTSRQSRHNRVEEQVASVHLRANDVPHPEQYNLLEQLALALTRAIAHLLDQHPNLDDRDRLYFSLGSTYLRPSYDGWGVTVGEWRRPDIGHRINRVFENLALMLNSNETFHIDDSFTLSLVVVRSLPRGGGKKRRRRRIAPGEVNASELPTKKRSILEIPRDDRNMCCIEALWIAYKRDTLNDAAFEAQYRLQHRKREPFQQECAGIQQTVGIPAGTLCGPTELEQFATYFAQVGYSIVVVDASRGNQAYRYGSCEKLLGLFYHNNHYHAMRSVKGFFTKNHYCFKCLRPYDNHGSHQCTANKDHCPACLQDGCEDYVTYRQTRTLLNPSECQTCNSKFYGPTCFIQHQTKNYQGDPADDTHLPVCRTAQRCLHCGKRSVYHGRDQHHPQHRCYHDECPSCLDYVDLATHKCYIQTEDELKERRERQRQRRQEQADFRARCRGYNPNRPRRTTTRQTNDDEPPITVYFDIEAMQVHSAEHGLQHIPNLVVASSPDYGDDHHHWYGPQCIRNFLAWIDELIDNNPDDKEEEEEEEEDNSKPKVTIIAHNFQGYDSYFIIQEYHRQARNLTQIRNGGKVLELKVGKPDHERIRYIDSMSFLGMPLAAFTKTFGLNENDLGLKKGFFPHFFNVPENQEYIGPLPAREFYGPHSMHKDRYKEFDRWYTAAQQEVFDFRLELEQYCKSDVQLLQAGCEVFRREFHELAGFDPFEHTTIASACSRDLRKSRLQRQTIASEPVSGWRLNTNHSLVALEWLEWQGRQLGRPLQHVGNTGEQSIHLGNKTYHVDGFDSITQTIYEFHGCFYHGCLTCHPQGRQEPHQQLHGRTWEDLYRATLHRDSTLRAAGYTLITLWEHEWTSMKASSKDLRTLIQSFHLQPPLKPRDAFFGGRTNAIQLYVDPRDQHQLCYYDFTSLYPYVNKYGQYPIKHPTFLYNPVNQNLNDYFGLATCTILPPSNLFHPVLPYRCGGKLVFPLCRTCAENNVNQPLHDRQWICTHTSEQRQLTGTWCTPELQKALEKGYTLVRIHEVWHFEEHQTGLFKDYVDTWLKIKEEASGFPDDCVTEPQKRQHVADYLENERVQLDYEAIAKNPGRRAVAKLMLNSMWGKFGQRLDKTHVREFTDPRDLHDFLGSGRYKISYVSPVTDERVEVYYKVHDPMIDVNVNLNIFVACFTTCWARLKLYDELDQLGERVVYFDTDSIVFIDGQSPLNNPSLGKYLGEFKDELKGDHIIEFCSGGPKNYGYRTTREAVECKVRGFTLNREGSQQLNFNIMVNNVQSEVLEPLDDGQVRTLRVNERTKIVRDSKTYELFTIPRHKTYRLVANKRIFPPSEHPNPFLTYPYGYNQINN